MATGENRASTSVLVDYDGLAWHRNFVEGIIFAGRITSLRLL
jgi:hypothetical protein